jgi:hypothetical protein
VPAGGTLHYVANEGGAYSTTTGLGYTLHDTGLSASTINALPTGTRAMVWAENGKCPTSLTSAFTSFVVAQKSNPKLYGYFLVDEPSSTSASCAAGIRAMADYIHANAPGKKAFIELTDYPGTYAAYAPSKTHADLVGLDPYPCRNDATACDFEGIGKEVSAMVAAGVPRASIVPTFQLFGDSTWRAPTKSELQGILAEWQEYVPQPANRLLLLVGLPERLAQHLPVDQDRLEGRHACLPDRRAGDVTDGAMTSRSPGGA